MACENWLEKLDPYLDGELSESAARTLGDHLRQCSQCAAEALNKVQQKRAVQAAGRRFTPDPAFRARVQGSLKTAGSKRWSLFWLPLATAVVLIVAGAIVFTVNRSGQRTGDERLISELADMHIATLASSNPVDVVSSDRHTVKPWFQGKIPFTFNLPELQDSAFTLVGGRVSYLNQSPGAELLFRVRQHQISVFIFQERALGEPSTLSPVATESSFNLRSWSHNGLRYFVIGDASGDDLDRLSGLINGAG
jgi:anti-sigma factor RsiW